MAQVASVAGSVLCSGSKTTQRQRDVCQGMHVDEEQIYLTYGRTHNTEARWRNWVGFRKRHNGPGDIVAEMKNQRGREKAFRDAETGLRRVSGPFRTFAKVRWVDWRRSEGRGSTHDRSAVPATCHTSNVWLRGWPGREEAVGGRCTCRTDVRTGRSCEGKQG